VRRAAETAHRDYLTPIFLMGSGHKLSEVGDQIADSPKAKDKLHY
jgi:hypothetical protein